MITRARPLPALLVAFLASIMVACAPQAAPLEAEPSPQSTPSTAWMPTPEPLVPTVAADRIAATATPAQVPAAGGNSAQLLPRPEPDGMRSRLGVSGAIDSASFDDELVQRLGPGWFLDWTIRTQPMAGYGPEFAHVVLMRDGGFEARRQELGTAIGANPGALWLISNEPDVPWQDDVTPETYAQEYNRLYEYIKSLDPTARVVAGGLSQPTAMRLRYLDRVMAAYQTAFGRPLPADAWHVHAFILREERDSWGVGIPKGFEEQAGELFEIEDHDDMAIFQRQILDFRRWMAENGQRDKPLIVSEYGILMPTEYGFSPEQVATFMEHSFDFLLFATDPEIGYPADQNRLVQRLAWFVWSDTVYPTGNLIDPESGMVTLAGERFADYAARLDEFDRENR